MALAKKIREALDAAGGSLSFKKLHEQVGGDDAKLSKALSNLSYQGKVKVGTDDEKTVTLKRRSAPPHGKGKKSAVKRGAKKPGRKTVRTYRDLANKAAINGHGNGVRDMALENLLGAGEILRQAIADTITFDPADRQLPQALANHERAEKLYRAAAGG